jgi:hypothetical protein
MIIAIVQGSTLVADDDARDAMHAIQRQITEHLRPAWEAATVDLVYVPKGGSPPDNAWTVNLVDVCDAKHTDGYHEFDGKPSGVVGVKTSTDDHTPWSSTLSHEVLELIVDPWATVCIQVGNTVMALEICDPVEGQPYEIDGVKVEDFVLPAYYRPGARGPWNFNQDAPLSGPVTLGPGGYQSSSSLGDWRQQNAKLARAAKLTMNPVSRRGRRVLRMLTPSAQPRG